MRSFDNRRARRASPRRSTQPGTGWERQPDQRSAERESWLIVRHGTRQCRRARLSRQEIRVLIISRRMTCDAV
ncbi:hypothetical protein DF038_19665 [Burkholderia cepacia]|uniref:Uncharacterized protein n=1 Tax=Burkholderia reimsis TaxID=2234132 RepID=A0A365R0Z7_9BURK|nr:hypothetical protein DPV79_05520 [Burkholderia reimsis]RRA21688.1 hypothetical protein DF038_19665 [Burkholderia cepacia]